MTPDLFTDVMELAELICQSGEAQDYLQCKSQLAEDGEATKQIIRFQKIKENYEEAQRFGRFHPNYHEAKKEAQLYQKEMFQHPVIRAYVESEKNLDKLLYEVSFTIAQAVSDEVMVPNSNWNRPNRGCKCKE